MSLLLHLLCLLGCTDYLDADQMKEYSGSGAMHILSVSGLHVGIIYLFLNSLLYSSTKTVGPGSSKCFADPSDMDLCADNRIFAFSTQGFYYVFA